MPQPAASEPHSAPQIPVPSTTTDPTDHQAQQQPISKNALKRLRKRTEWENSKDERRLKRQEKRKERKVRVRTEKQALIAQGADPDVVYNRNKPPTTLVPVSLVLDCDFEQYMTDKERISLSSQLTRSYSDNRQAPFRSHLYIAGFRGRLAERFRDGLRSTHKNWKGVTFWEGDFLECARKAREDMRRSAVVTAPLQRSVDEPVPWTRDEKDPFPLPDVPEPPLDEEYKDVVYLSSDSPYTLERLEPNTTYIVGGLVDKNREKGLCYRRARERGIRTAKLPIGQFMVMQSRQVLATNHVVEIMLRWLEYEDWGKAFLSVIPKRKGGILREDESKGEDASEQGESDSEGEQEDVVEEEVAA
jgi:tRNA (guanine9-N1)-methyltransferase